MAANARIFKNGLRMRVIKVIIIIWTDGETKENGNCGGVFERRLRRLEDRKEERRKKREEKKKGMKWIEYSVAVAVIDNASLRPD